MKSKITLFSAIALMVVFWASGCKTGGETGSATGTGDKVAIEVKLAPGMVYKQLNKTVQNSEQSVMGMKTKTSSDTEIYLKNEVLTVDAQGTAEVRVTYERVKMDLDNGMAGKSSFDSDKVDGEVPLQGKSYMSMVGKSITYKIDKHGTVVAVAGVDALMDGLMETIADEGKGPEMDIVKNTLKSTFGDDAMKSMMQSASIMYPEEPLAEGQTWQKKINQVGAMPLIMEVTYKVDHIDGEKVILSFEGTVTSDKTHGLDLGVASMTMDLTGDYDGTSEISRKTGLVLNSTVNQKMSGSMSMIGMKVPMSISQTITIAPY